MIYSSFAKRLTQYILIFSIFFSVFSSSIETVFAAAPICIVEDVTTGTKTKVTCPKDDLNIRYIQFKDDYCYLQKKSGQTVGSWIEDPKNKDCPLMVPLEPQRATPVPGTYTFTSTTDSVTVTAYLELTKNPEYKKYKSYFQWAPTPTPGINNPLAKSFDDFTTTVPARVAASKINDFGTYGLKLTNITPNISYNLREVLVNDDGIDANTTDPVAIKDSTFVSDGGKGVGVKQDFDIAKDFEDRSYRLLAPLPGLTVLMDPDLCAEQAAIGNTGNICDINDFLNFALLLLIGISAVLLVIRIVLEGFKYITSDVVKVKMGSKQSIQDAALGILLVLSAFIILNTINPKLVENTFNIERLEIASAMTYISTEDFQKITGEEPKSKSEYVKLVEQVSKQMGIDACIVKATIEHESNWVPRAVGCDENVKSSQVPSRRAFLQSGIKLNGQKFSATSNTSADIKNNCNFDTSKQGFGLDWRFSKGGGLMQVTLFPQNYNTPSWYSGVKEGGSNWLSRNTQHSEWASIFKPEDNIRKGITILKGNLSACNGDIRRAFRAYQTGSCDVKSSQGNLVENTVAKKYATYSACKTQK